MGTTCSIEGCTEPVFVKSRGWCKKHYTRWHRTGDPLTAKYDRGVGPDRWRTKYTEDANGCWIWTGSHDRMGYGQYDVLTEGVHRNWRAHRYVYEQMVRPLTATETLDHLCRVHACVNPAHLEPVSHAENVRRGDATGDRSRNKQFCKRGHEYTPENTYQQPNGRRGCIECQRIRLERITRREQTLLEQTHCVHGHEYTPENTIQSESGRNCRTCQRERSREYMRRRRAQERST